MKKFLFLLATTVLTGIVSSHAATMIADFETSSGYPSGGSAVSFIGYNGWTRVVGDNDTDARLTPDSASGYTSTISDSQSALLLGSTLAVKSFASSGLTAGDLAVMEISWQQAVPSGQFHNENLDRTAGLFITNTTNGTIPIGIFARRKDDVVNIWLQGSTQEDTEIAYAFGGSGVGASGLSGYVYQFTMEIDLATHTMTGWYDTGSGKVSLGSVAFDNTLTAATLAADYGFGMRTTGVATFYDNIEFQSIPEPSSAILLGLAVSLFSLVTWRWRQRK